MTKSSKEKREEAHNNLYLAIGREALIASEHLDVPHVVYLGVHYFASVAKDCAPNKKEAKEMLKNVVDDAMNGEYSDD